MKKNTQDVLCDICGKGFYSSKKMRAHRNTHEESNAIKCDICLAYVSTEKALRRHHANVHMKDYVCQMCGKKCTTRKALHNHVYVSFQVLTNDVYPRLLVGLSSRE